MAPSSFYLSTRRQQQPRIHQCEFTGPCPPRLVKTTVSALSDKRRVWGTKILCFVEEGCLTGGRTAKRELNNNNNVHLSCAHQRPERSHDTY